MSWSMRVRSECRKPKDKDIVYIVNQSSFTSIFTIVICARASNYPNQLATCWGGHLRSPNPAPRMSSTVLKRKLVFAAWPIPRRLIIFIFSQTRLVVSNVISTIHGDVLLLFFSWVETTNQCLCLMFSYFDAAIPWLQCLTAHKLKCAHQGHQHQLGTAESYWCQGFINESIPPTQLGPNS